MALYQSFYGLARDAFASPENPAQMFVAQTYHDSVVTFVRALIARKPFIAITGEGGSGKTTVLDAALQALGDRVRVTRARCEQDEPLDLASLLENALGKEWALYAPTTSMRSSRRWCRQRTAPSIACWFSTTPN